MTRPGEPEQLCSSPDYYLLFTLFVLLKLGHADQQTFALSFGACLGRQNGCQSVRYRETTHPN